MTTPEPTRSSDELLSYVLTKLVRNPNSRELKRAHTMLLLNKKAKLQLYAIPIVAVGLFLLGTYISFGEGDIRIFGITIVVSILFALLYYPIRRLYNWELRKKLKKIEKIIADVPE